MTERLGLHAGVFPIFLGYAAGWIVYRFWVPFVEFYAEKPSRLWGAFFRGMVQLLVFAFMALSFSYADKIKVNKGVISSLFTSTILFSGIFFRILYNELITFKKAMAMAVIIVGVVCIGVGKPSVTNSVIEVVDY